MYSRVLINGIVCFAFPDRVRIYAVYDNTLYHWIEIGFRGCAFGRIHLQWKFLHFPDVLYASGKDALPFSSPRYLDIDNYRLANTQSLSLSPPLSLSLSYKYLLARQYSGSISGVSTYSADRKTNICIVSFIVVSTSARMYLYNLYSRIARFRCA